MAILTNDGGGSLLDYNAVLHSTAIYRLMVLMVLAGWVHEASSDGTNVSNTSGNGNNQITSAGEMATNNAWFVLSQPAIASGIGYPGNRQIIFRRGTSDTNWMVAYVPANTDGSKQTKTANGTTAAVPTFTTTKILLGTLPDTAASWLSSPSTKHYAIAAENVAPYTFYMVNWAIAGGSSAANGSMYLDFVLPSSMDILDTDGAVVQLSASNGLDRATVGTMDTVASPQFYTRRGLTGEAWIKGAALAYHTAAGAVIPAGLGRLSYGTLKEGRVPLFYGYGGESSGLAHQASPEITVWKGESYMLRWRNGGYPLGTLVQRVTSGDRVVIGDLTWWWDGSTQIAIT